MGLLCGVASHLCCSKVKVTMASLCSLSALDTRTRWSWTSAWMVVLKLEGSCGSVTKITGVKVGSNQDPTLRLDMAWYKKQQACLLPGRTAKLRSATSVLKHCLRGTPDHCPNTGCRGGHKPESNRRMPRPEACSIPGIPWHAGIPCL